MTKIDMHIHGAPWDNGWAAYRRAVWNGWRTGCKVIGIAEHGPRFNHRVPFRSLYFREFDRYFDTLQEIKLEFVDETEVLMGLELDYNEKMVAYYKDLLPRLPLDFVVGSIHSVSDWVIDLPDSFAQSSLRGLDANGIYQAYFLELQNAAKSGLFHFLAHPDFVKKALPLLKMSKPKDLSPLFRETADILSACEVGIEINTYGKILPEVGEYYPDEEFLFACFKAKVPLTVSSDAHQPQRTGDGIEEAINYAYKIGFRQIYIWRKGERIPFEI